MKGEAKTSVALAFDAACQTEAEARRAEDGAVVVGSGSLSASPAGEAMVSPADLIRCSEQVEGVVRRVASMVEQFSGTLSALQHVKTPWATCSSQCSRLEIALQQLVDNHAAKSDPSRDGEDVRERLMQKLQLKNEAALWKKTSSRRHWPNPAESRRF